jgi:hypothetical protein
VFDGEDFNFVDGWWTFPEVMEPRRDSLRRQKPLQIARARGWLQPELLSVRVKVLSSPDRPAKVASKEDL